MKTIKQVTNSLRNGGVTVTNKKADSRYAIAAEKDANGVLTGNEVAVVRGGNYRLGILETSFLGSLQSYGVRSAFAEIGADFIDELSKAETIEAAATTFGLKGDGLNQFCGELRKRATAYLKALHKHGEISGKTLENVTGDELWFMVKAISERMTSQELEHNRHNDEQKNAVIVEIGKRRAERVKADAEREKEILRQAAEVRKRQAAEKAAEKVLTANA